MKNAVVAWRVEGMGQREEIRLVIWDLDETFWKGTLTEGGITEHIASNHRIVIELARRGIMSSICSKNELEKVKPILHDCGLWDYFIFPSIDWSAKAPRIAALIEAVQLRAPTVLFVDDNPSNRAEAVAWNPGLQVADPADLEGLLDSVLCQGKPDPQLARLANYKLLEQRARDQAVSAGDVTEFLRSSNIQVVIEHDIEPHISRAIELINRTNQLNFTKVRLSENDETAKADLRKLMHAYFATSGLVRVRDNYGDYGFVGFYVAHGDVDKSVLLHYCFSCRVLGMAVEKYVYRKLNRPRIKVVGNVVSDLFDDSPIDWINTDSSSNQTLPSINLTIPEIRLRGGCELQPIAHYLKINFENIQVETSLDRAGIFVRLDSATNLLASPPTSDEALSELAAVGLIESDFANSFFAPAKEGTILVFNNWSDNFCHIYKHKKYGFKISCSFFLINQVITKMSNEELEIFFANNQVDAQLDLKRRAVITHLRNNYEFVSYGLGGDDIRVNYERLREHVPSGAHLIIIPRCPYSIGENGKLSYTSDYESFNKAVVEVLKDSNSISILNIDDVIEKDDEYYNDSHFSRIVYFRIYKKLLKKIMEIGCRVPKA